MRLTMQYRFGAVLAILQHGVVAALTSSGECKCGPSNTYWPSPETWFDFNVSLSGHLLRGVPPAAVCYENRPEYNLPACSRLIQVWHSSRFHAQDPISIDYPIWANDSCNPIYPNGTSINGDPAAGIRGCSQGRYPAYVVNATSAAHVQAAFIFAKRYNIRLNIKSTGHSFPGRSTAYGSLSIWTHNLKGIKVHQAFQQKACPQTCTAPQMAVTVGAGEVGIDVLAALAPYNAAIVTGGNPDVGIIGWFTGGGHGFLSSDFGMGADNVLEATIATPRGEVVVANEYSHPDLFFAIRGGGGGTFGVIIEATIKAFPTPKTTSYTLAALLTDSSQESEWWDLMGYFNAQTVQLKDGGAQGYYYMVGRPAAPSLAFLAVLNFYNKPATVSEAVMEPIISRLKVSSAFVGFRTSVQSTSTFYEWFNTTVTSEAVASGDSAMGSRLLSRKALSRNQTEVAEMLRAIGPSVNSTSNPMLIGHLIANSANRALDIGMNPAWRDAIVHLVVVESWQEGMPFTHAKSIYNDITHNKTQLLRNFDPDSGAYFNEADPFEPNWQKAFFGPNYPRLKAIKQKYDPGELLWCRSCVGSENWIEDLENGPLCRTLHDEYKEMRTQY